ncbi:MAG: hypothetical protein QME63_06995 [Actinomycetota bacterium]|nr:hypothetical protein [Actinomycetota bacterium]
MGNERRIFQALAAAKMSVAQRRWGIANAYTTRTGRKMAKQWGVNQ